MGDSDTPRQAERPFDAPQSVIITNPGAVKVAGDVARETVGALGAQPILLLIVVLNMVFALSGAYFFTRLEDYRHSERLQIIEIIARCQLSDHPAQRREERP